MNRPSLRRACAGVYAVLGAGLVLVACSRGAVAEHPVPLPPNLAALTAGMQARVTKAAESLRAGPDDAARWLALGMTYEANDLFALGIQCYRAAIELAPDGKTWHRLACAEAGRGELEHAADAMRRSIELVPTYAPSHWRLGNYLFDLGEFDQALRAYAESSRLDPEQLGGPIGIARVHLQRGEPELALAVLEPVHRARPGERALLSLLRNAYLQAGRAEEAARIEGTPQRRVTPGKDPWYRELREFREEPQMEKALELLESGSAAEAAALLEAFVAEEPDDLNASAYLALAYGQLGRYDEARAVVTRALAREPDNLLVLRALAHLEERTGHTAEALAVLEKVVRIDPSDAASLLKKGGIERASGRNDAALESLRRAFALDQRDLAQLVDIGTLELALGDRDGAIASFERARRAGVAGNDLVLGLARAWSQAGRTREALELLESTPDRGRAGETLLAELRAAVGEAR